MGSLKWIIGDPINTRKTVQKRKATGRSTKELMKTYRDRKGTNRGYK